MLILLDCRPLQQAGAASERTRFLLSCAAELTVRQGVEWLFLLDKRGDLPLPAGKKIVARKSFWLIPRIARKHKVELIMMTGGKPVTATKVPQYCWVSGGTFLRDPSGKDVPVAPAPDEVMVPLSQEDRESVKGQVAEGKEYFFTDINGAAVSEVINLLKAFSLFKKRQLSNMKLVLAGEADAEIVEKLDSYKYRQDVCLLSKAGDGQVRGAYAVISLPRRDSLGIDVLNAWKAGVPVITSEAREAVVQVSAGDPATLADGLKTLYKDEALRNELIGKAALRSADFSLRQSVRTIWEAIGGN